MNEVQTIIWQVMKEIKTIIQDENLEYYMLGGTLLGAVRHKGFIPWDDDIDIGMPRKDYERFLSIVQDRLPEHLKLHTYQNEQSHHYYFSRIVDTRYALKRTGSTVERQEDVWVDIFPLDGMPNLAFSRMIQMIRLLYARMRYHISTIDKVNLKRPNRPWTERVIIWLTLKTGFGTHSDPKKWLDKIDRLLKKYSIDDTNWVVNFMGQYKFKEMFPKRWYGEGRMYRFEDDRLCGPKSYHKILTRQYGDYMTPPKNKNAHAAELVK